MRVLVVAPHMDDEVLGVGGSIVRHVQQGDEVQVCFVAHRTYNHRFDEERNSIERRCAANAKRVLGYQKVSFLELSDERLDRYVQDIAIPLERVQQEYDPECVYLPHRGDNNQDHRAVFRASQVVFRPAATPSLCRIFCYEVPSSTEQVPPAPEYAFLPNCFVDISTCIEEKIEALKCYGTELRHFPHPRSAEGIEVLAKYRGMASGFRFAEAFSLLRWRIP